MGELIFFIVVSVSTIVAGNDPKPNTMCAGARATLQAIYIMTDYHRPDEEVMVGLIGGNAFR